METGIAPSALLLESDRMLLTLVRAVQARNRQRSA